MTWHHLIKTAATLCTALTVWSAQAQSFPNKTISLVVPYPAGGPSDFFARKVQPDAAAKLGQTLIVDNIGGAGGSIALGKVLNGGCAGFCVNGQSTWGMVPLVRQHNVYQETRSPRRAVVWPAGQLQET